MTDDLDQQFAARSELPAEKAALAADLSADTRCCDGDAIKPRCQICSVSPTYWRGDSEAR